VPVHDNWARYYDFVYDECFGTSFWRLTAETLALVGEVQPSPARVLDLGAGTGRIAIPLALLGYDITAVEWSAGMSQVLADRAARVGAAIDLRRGDLRALDRVLGSPGNGGGASFDLGVAIFTVLNYLVDEADIAALAGSLAARVRPGGHVIFDLAARRLFASALFESERLHREIDVRPLGANVFSYRDTGCGVFEGQRFEYEETFTFRFWRDDEVLPIFAASGLSVASEATARLRESGSRWFVLART
jgi:SAM-dependent methyltransferase